MTGHLPVATALALAAALAACSAPPRPPERLPPAINPTAGSFDGRIPLDDQGGFFDGKDDLDGDGAADCWRAVHSRGQGFGGVTLSVQIGCAGPMSTFSTVAPEDRMAVAIPLPLEYRLKPALLLSAIDLVFGEEHLRRVSPQQPFTAPMADGSLLWLVDRHRIKPMGTSLPFFEVRAYTPVWTPGRPVVPESQVVVLTAPRDRNVLEGLGVLDEAPKPIPGLDSARVPHTLVVYNGRLHGSIQPLGRCTRWEIQTTGRSVGVYDSEADHTSWVWTADVAPSPLRASFFDAICFEDLVFVEVVPTAFDGELVVVAPEAGRFGRIRLTKGEGWSLDVEKRRLLYGTGIEPVESLREKLLVVDPAAPSSW